MQPIMTFNIIVREPYVEKRKKRRLGPCKSNFLYYLIECTEEECQKRIEDHTFVRYATEYDINEYSNRYFNGT